MKKNNTQKRTRRLVYMAFLSALVIILQLFCQFILQANALPISLVLLPVVIGGILFGAGAGATLGAVFGIVVFVCSFMGLDKAGFMLCEVNPFMTGVLCIAKGLVAGWASASVYKLVSKKSGNMTVNCIIAAAVTPIVNTGIFLLGMLTYFKDILYTWAGGADIITYVIISLVGINFIIEFLINVIITPLLMPSIAKNKDLKEYLAK